MVTPPQPNLSMGAGRISRRIPRRKTWFILLLAACLLAMTSDNALRPVPPTPKKPVIEDYHGVKVEDDYQWIENWNDPVVRSCVGIYDTLRHELSPNAVFNVTEYGTVKDPAEFKALYA